MAIGWQRLRTHLGTTITGNTSTSERSISKLALPEPMITAARSSVTGTESVGQDLTHLVAAAQVLGEARGRRPGRGHPGR